MNISILNSPIQPSAEAKAKTRQKNNIKDYSHRDLYFTLFYPDLDQTFQAIDPHSMEEHADVSFDSEYDDDENDGQEILDPKREDDDILDPQEDQREREFPNQHDDEDLNPNREVPEENNDLTKNDGAFIEEPTREIDGPYRPGHGDKGVITPIEEEFPNEDLKENIKTDF